MEKSERLRADGKKIEVKSYNIKRMNTSSLNTFDVQTTKNGSMATIAEKRENAFADESISMLCTAIQDLKEQFCVLNAKLAQILGENTPTSEEISVVEEDKVLETQPQMLTIEEAAKYLNVKKSTVYRMTSQHRIKFYKPTGKRVYFDKADLDEWMKSKAIKSDEEIKADATNYVKFGKMIREKPQKEPDDERTIRNRLLAQEIRRKYKLG